MSWKVLDTEVPFGFAHQGGTDVAPGNTIAAFDHARSLGYRYFETDVHATADGVLAVYHDEELEAGTGVRAKIGDLSWSELSELRVGGEHPIPSFDEVVTRYPEVRFNVEPKGDTAVELLIEAIRRHDLLDRILVGSFNGGRVRRVRSALGPDLATSPGPTGVLQLYARAALWPRGRSRFAAVQVPHRAWVVDVVPAWLVERLHRLGVQVHVWTINDEAEMVALLDAGVDAVMTDRVETLRRVLEARDAWPPDPTD